MTREEWDVADLGCGICFLEFKRDEEVAVVNRNKPRKNDYAGPAFFHVTCLSKLINGKFEETVLIYQTRVQRRQEL